jgi:cobalt-zinc-cadmium efflux system outer membrane protein
MAPLLRLAAVSLVAFTAGAPAAGSDAPAAAGGDGLTLGAAVERALAANPTLRGFAYRLKAGDAEVALAGQRRAAQLSLEVENVLGSGDLSGADAAETTLALSQVIELGDKRALRAEAAEASRAVVAVERQAAQLDAVAAVTRRFIRVVALQEQQALMAEATRLAQRTAVDVERRVSAARSPEAELLRARAAVAEAGLAEARLAGQLAVARRQLAAEWGATADDFGPLLADLYAVRPPEAFDQLAARLEASPDFLRFASEARLREAELRLARSEARPDIELSGGVRRLEEIDEQAFVFGVAMPVGTRRRAEPRIAAAAAWRELSAAEHTAAQLRARTQLFELHQELSLAVAEVRALRDEVLPSLDGALAQSQYAYERGRYSYLELVDAQQARRLAQQRLLEAAERGRLIWVEIERVTGHPLEEGR